MASDVFKSSAVLIKSLLVLLGVVKFKLADNGYPVCIVFKGSDRFLFVSAYALVATS